MSTIKSPLSDDDRKVTCDALQGGLIDMLDLTLQAKQVHWNLIGHRFRSIHLQLDDVVATARQFSDSFAEREVTLGVNPDGRARTVAEHTQVPDLEAGYINDDKAVAAMVDRLGGIVARMRERVEATEKSDPVTQDLLIEATQELEQHYWMFQASQ